MNNRPHGGKRAVQIRPGTRVELRSYIRFQLEQLLVKNAAHEFERLAFELARLRIASNVMPATGPVQGGGDQGRDFESYRSYLGHSPLKNTAFAAPVQDGFLVGACSLEQSIVSKIKRDLKTIFGIGERPTHVAYFCARDVSVASRHKLKVHCTEQYQATLDIFDGQAIADMLADPDAAWIAEEYLEIPADTFPVASQDDQYLEARDRWLTNNAVPLNYADFLSVKRGLRTATYEDEAKPNISGWLKAMGSFLHDTVPDRLKQRARYEIAVGELRGKGSLDPALSLVDDFFQALSADSPPAELLDAAVLTVYCWSAPAHGQASLPEETTRARLLALEDLLDDAYKLHTSSGDHCTICEARAMMGLIPRDDASRQQTLDRFFHLWEEVIRRVKKTPLFPVTHIADILDVLASFIDGSSRLRALIDQVDALIGERAGKGAAAERALRRAAGHLDADRYVAAIDELQRTKAGWFTGENIERSILAMLVISEAYESLRLHFASRYYAAGALFTALNQKDDRLAARVAQAMFRLTETFFPAGEGLTYVYGCGAALKIHAGLADDAEDWSKHPEVQRCLVHAARYRAIVRRIAPALLPRVDAAIASWPLEADERSAFVKLSEGEPWASMPVSEIEQRLASDLGCPPFEDLGPQRTLAWSAFGVTWTIHSSSDEANLLAALEVATTLQIVHVDFADADLVTIPSNTDITVELQDINGPHYTQSPDNGRLAWRVVMPRAPSAGDDRFNSELAGLVMTVLGQATALPFDRFQALAVERINRGLPIRLASVRPVRELMKFSLPEGLDLTQLAALPRPSLQTAMTPIENPELGWRTGPGPGYSREKADQYLRNRYNILDKSLRITLPRLLADERCRELIRQLRARGFLDWHILNVLSATVSQWQVERSAGRSLGPIELAPLVMNRITREETDSDEVFDLTQLTADRLELQLNMLAAAAFTTWSLSNHRRTPDFKAMKRLLDERYGHSTDDVHHDDPFPGL